MAKTQESFGAFTSAQGVMCANSFAVGRWMLDIDYPFTISLSISPFVQSRYTPHLHSRFAPRQSLPTLPTRSTLYYLIIVICSRVSRSIFHFASLVWIHPLHTLTHRTENWKDTAHAFITRNPSLRLCYFHRPLTRHFRRSLKLI